MTTKKVLPCCLQNASISDLIFKIYKSYLWNLSLIKHNLIPWTSWDIVNTIILLLFSHLVPFDSCDPIVCNPPCFSAHGIFQARILEWVAISFSHGSSQLGTDLLHWQVDSLSLSYQGSPISSCHPSKAACT